MRREGRLGVWMRFVRVWIEHEETRKYYSGASLPDLALSSIGWSPVPYSEEVVSCENQHSFFPLRGK